MLAQRNFNFHARVGIIAQNLHDAAYRLCIFARLLQNFQHHHLPGLCSDVLSWSNKDILTNTTIFRYHELNSMLLIQPPDQTLGGALQHLHYTGLAAPAPVNARFAYHDSIAMQRFMHFLGTQYQIGTAIIRNQKTKAIGMALYLALNQVKFIHHADSPLAVTHYLTIALHSTQAARKQFSFVLINTQHVAQLFFSNRHALLFQ